MDIKIIVALSIILIITTVSLLEIYVFEPDEEPMKQLSQIICVSISIMVIIGYIIGNLFIIGFCGVDFFENVERLSQNNPSRNYGRQVDEGLNNINTLPV